jgi:hypothetical protein
MVIGPSVLVPGQRGAFALQHLDQEGGEINKRKVKRGSKMVGIVELSQVVIVSKLGPDPEDASGLGSCSLHTPPLVHEPSRRVCIPHCKVIIQPELLTGHANIPGFVVSAGFDHWILTAHLLARQSGYRLYYSYHCNSLKTWPGSGRCFGAG